MILIDDVKYSCIECIRGHRSSQCRHHGRPLLQVRSKGRPNTAANGNPNHRVAVFAEEINHPCANKAKDVIVIIKASPKKIIDLTSGKIVGSYADAAEKKSGPVINENSFVNSSTCCKGAAGKVTKSKSCGCGPNASKTVSKSSILSRYFKRHPENKNKLTFVNETAPAEPRHYNVVSVQSCSIPGTCCCGDGCTCEGCLVHNKSLDVELIKNDNELTHIFNNDAQFSLKTEALPTDGLPALTDGLPVKTEDGLTDNSLKPPVSGIEGLQPTEKIPYLTYLADLANPLSPEADTSPESGTECVCPADNCSCTNCETHGIINGVKLDELFSESFDPKLLSFLGSQMSL